MPEYVPGPSPAAPVPTQYSAKVNPTPQIAGRPSHAVAKGHHDSTRKADGYILRPTFRSIFFNPHFWQLTDRAHLVLDIGQLQNILKSR